LVRVDTNDVPIFQYGLFTNSASLSGTNHYFVAAQGQNLAGLLTAQTERAFEAIVDSAAVFGVLTNINGGEALSNSCPGVTDITHWAASVQEWVTSASGTIPLNFFPTSTNLNVIDAWITPNRAFTNFSYDVANKTITITDTDAAPSHLIVNYAAFLVAPKPSPTITAASVGSSAT